MKKTYSKNLFKHALEIIPGGVNSPVRAWKAVGGTPLFIEKGKGAVIYDADGNSFIDYVCSWGPLILGHAHPKVIAATEKALHNGTSFGAPTEAGLKLCELLVKQIPSIEKVRLVNSGTEAVMSAIRLARGYTGKNKIIKFEGSYHGHWDPLLVSAGSGLATFSVSSSAGVPHDVIKDTLIAPYNDIEAVKKLFARYGTDIACIIVEPVAGNMGVVLPEKDFLSSLRSITEKYGSLLVFDEVITGFRLGAGGAQALYRIKPDLTCLGKIIGGGMPVGAYGGKAKIMDKVSPVGDVYQAGTLSGNPVSCACGIATIKEILKEGFYRRLDSKAEKLCKELKNIASKNKIKIVINRAGSMFTVFFTHHDEVKNFTDAQSSDTALYARYFNLMLCEGVYIPPSQFEANFISSLHSDAQIRKTLDAAEKSFTKLSKI